MRDDRKYLFVIGAGASVAFSKDIDKKIPQSNNKEDNNKKDGKDEEKEENFAHFPTGDGLLKRLKNKFLLTEYLNYITKYIDKLRNRQEDNLDYDTYYSDRITYRTAIEKLLKAFYPNFKIEPYKYYDDTRQEVIKYLEKLEDTLQNKVKREFNKMITAGKNFYEEYKKHANIPEGASNIQTAEVILASILSSHPTKSIDYFIENDLKHFLKAELEKYKKAEELTDDILNNLYNLMVEFIKAKVCFILSLCHIESLEKCYFYDIIYNHIGIENFNKNAKVLTFNYDLLLEKTIDYINSKEPERQIIYKDKDKDKDKSLITHIYGDVESDIKFMEEREEEEYQKIYQQMFKDAHYIYFLGFGFDEINAERLGIKNCNFEGKKVFICNFGGLSKVDYIIYEHFGLKARDFTLVREKSRLSQSKGFDLYISELSLQESLKTQFFF